MQKKDTKGLLGSKIKFRWKGIVKKNNNSKTKCWNPLPAWANNNGNIALLNFMYARKSAGTYHSGEPNNSKTNGALSTLCVAVTFLPYNGEGGQWGENCMWFYLHDI